MSKPTTIDAQISLFEIAGIKLDAGSELTSMDFEKAIKRLTKERNKARKREKEEATRKAAEERERKEREERGTREAHVAAVTSMDLPMDWENAFSATCELPKSMRKASPTDLCCPLPT